jgi:hypothetical protein
MEATMSTMSAAERSFLALCERLGVNAREQEDAVLGCGARGVLPDFAQRVRDRGPQGGAAIVNAALSGLVTLGRDGMGPDATEEDFLDWVSHVSEAFEGSDVEVELRGTHEVQSKLYESQLCTCDEELYSIVQDLWDDWCGGGGAS